MSRPIDYLLAALLIGGTGATQAGDPYPVGRPATPAELRAWDIDVRPDFAGCVRAGEPSLRDSESGMPSAPPAMAPLARSVIFHRR